MSFVYVLPYHRYPIHEFRPSVVAIAERMLITVCIIIFHVSLLFIFSFVFFYVVNV